MRLAWAASMVAQSAYAFALWRTGARDLWLQFLVVDVAVGMLRWPAWGTDAGFTLWMLTEPICQALRFAAAFEIARRAKDPAWAFTGLALAFLASSVAMTWSPESWPMAKRARLMLFQLCSLGAAGIAGGAYVGGATPNLGVIGYFGLDVARCIAEELTRSRADIETINLLFLWCSAALLSFCAIREVFPRRDVRHHG